MRKVAAAAALLLALAWPVGASSGAGAVHVAGSGIGTGVAVGDHVEVGARADADGSNPQGHMEMESTLTTGLPLHLGGTVDCVRVAGNRAVVLARLPQPFTTDDIPGLVFTHIAVALEDNGPPVHGQPTDRMLDFLLREETADRFCTTDAGFAFLSALATPLESGNYVVDN